MPDAHESCRQYARLATHMLSVNCLYQMKEKNCKGEFEKCGGLLIWVRESPMLSMRETILATSASGSIHQFVDQIL